MNKLIIKIDDAQAPKLGSEEPLSIINLQDLINMPESINFKNLKPLFRFYDSFTENHYEYD